MHKCDTIYEVSAMEDGQCPVCMNAAKIKDTSNTYYECNCLKCGSYIIESNEEKPLDVLQQQLGACSGDPHAARERLSARIRSECKRKEHQEPGSGRVRLDRTTILEWLSSN